MTGRFPEKTLIFHIGDHKTGSTTIQNLFATKQLHLTSEKLLYPGNLNHNYLLGQFISEARVSCWKYIGPARFATSQMVKGNPNRPNLPMLRKLISETDARYVVFSAEEFENIDPRDMKRVWRRWFADLVTNIRIISYVRPHAARFTSNYSELVKLGEFRGSLDAYLERLQETGRLHYADRYKRWRDVFGGSLIVRPMLRDQLVNGSVVDDFMCHAFDGAPFCIGKGTPANEAVALPELMLLSFVQQRFQKTVKNKFCRHTMGREIARYLGEFSEGGFEAEKVSLHSSLAHQISEFYMQDAMQLDREFFGGKALFEDALRKAVVTAQSEPLSLHVEDYFSNDELRRLEAVREVLWNMLQVDRNWANLFHQNRITALHRDAETDS